VENASRPSPGAHGLSFAAFRYFNAAGAAEDGTIGEDHTIPRRTLSRSRSTPRWARPNLQIFGTDYPTPDGTCLRDYVHVDDLSRAHIAVFDRLANPARASSTISAPAADLEPRGHPRRREGHRQEGAGHRGPRRAGDPPALYADSQGQRELGWKVKFPDIDSTAGRSLTRMASPWAMTALR
jgi:UDP-glucose 4-epimerase